MPFKLLLENEYGVMQLMKRQLNNSDASTWNTATIINLVLKDYSITTVVDDMALFFTKYRTVLQQFTDGLKNTNKQNVGRGRITALDRIEKLLWLKICSKDNC